MIVNIFNPEDFDIRYCPMPHNSYVCMSCGKATSDYYVFVPSQKLFSDYYTFGLTIHKDCLATEKLMPSEKLCSRMESFFKNFKKNL